MVCHKRGWNESFSLQIYRMTTQDSNNFVLDYFEVAGEQEKIGREKKKRRANVILQQKSCISVWRAPLQTEVGQTGR